MKTFLLTTLTILTACSFYVGLSPSKVRALKYSVANITVVDDHGNKLGSGTAWAVDDDHLVTAEHICAYMQNIVIREGPFLTSSLTVVYTNAAADVCILKGNPGYTPLNVSARSIREGSVIYAYGYPRGLRRVLTTGYVGPVVYTSRGVFRQLSVRITGGNSGGPVLNSRGEVVCVIVAGITRYDQVSYCTTFKGLQNGISSIRG